MAGLPLDELGWDGNLLGRQVRVRNTINEQFRHVPPDLLGKNPYSG